MKQVNYNVREEQKSSIMLRHVVGIASIALELRKGYWNLMLRIQQC
jgi:hypothetical protein